VKIEILDEAEKDIATAMFFYESQSEGLGNTFKSVAKSTIKRIVTSQTA